MLVLMLTLAHAVPTQGGVDPDEPLGLDAAVERPLCVGSFWIGGQCLDVKDVFDIIAEGMDGRLYTHAVLAQGVGVYRPIEVEDPPAELTDARPGIALTLYTQEGSEYVVYYDDTPDGLVAVGVDATLRGTFSNRRVKGHASYARPVPSPFDVPVIIEGADHLPLTDEIRYVLPLPALQGTSPAADWELEMYKNTTGTIYHTGPSSPDRWIANGGLTNPNPNIGLPAITPSPFDAPDADEHTCEELKAEANLVSEAICAQQDINNVLSGVAVVGATVGVAIAYFSLEAGAVPVGAAGAGTAGATVAKPAVKRVFSQMFGKITSDQWTGIMSVAGGATGGIAYVASAHGDVCKQIARAKNEGRFNDCTAKERAKEVPDPMESPLIEVLEGRVNTLPEEPEWCDDGGMPTYFFVDVLVGSTAQETPDGLEVTGHTVPVLIYGCP